MNPFDEMFDINGDGVLDDSELAFEFMFLHESEEDDQDDEEENDEHED